MDLKEYNQRKAQKTLTLEEYNKGKTNKDTKKDEKVILKTEDGIEFGAISSNAYRAISNGTLEYYNSSDAEEKKVLERYKKYAGIGRNFDVVKSQYDKDKFGKGNIDLTNRPVYKNKDGKISTVDSFSTNIDGVEVLLPTIVKDKNGNAKRLTEKEAIEHYYKTGQYLGKFNTVAEANEYAQSLHIDQDLYYSATPDLTDKEQKVLEKYGINPITFSTEDFETWALNHGYEYNAFKEGNGDATFVPKYKGFKKVPTKEEQSDFKILSKLAGKEYLKDAAEKYPITFSTATVVSAPIREAMSIGSNVASAVSTATGNGATTDSWGENLVENTDLVRQTISEEHASKWFGGASGKLGNYGALTYNGLMSIGDMVTTSVVTKQIGLGLGLTDEKLIKFTSNATSGLLASNSIQSTILEKKKEGYSDEKAVVVGFATGAAEYITEKFALEKIFGAPGSFIKKGIVGFVTEFAEEGSSDVISKTADYLIAGDDSTIKKNINNYIQNGKSKKEATKLAIQDSLWETLSAGVVGGFSGMAVSSAYQGFSVPEIKQTGKTVRPIASKIVQSGLALDKNSAAYKHAEKLAKKGVNNISDYELGAQHIYNVEQAEYENAQAKKSTFADVPNEIEATEKTTVNVGDTFVENDTNKKIRVIDRNDTATTIEITTYDGKKEIKILPNNTADSLIGNDKYTNISPKQITITTVGDSYEVYGEAAKVIAKELGIETTKEVVNGVQTETVHFPKEALGGLVEEFSGEYVFTEPVVAKTKVAPNESVAPSSKNINLTRVGKYYAVYGEQAKLLAANLGTKTQQRNINGVETDVLLLPADKALEMAPAIAEDFNFIFSDNPSTTTVTTEAKNEVVADESIPTNEDTSTDDVVTTEVDYEAVAKAVDETLSPEAKEGMLSGLDEKGKQGGLVTFAERLTKIYKETGSLAGMEKFFTDGGKKVIDTIEGKTETIDTKVVEEKNDIEVLNKGSESDTLKENETTKTVIEETPVEREDNGNGRKRNSILPENSGRSDNGGTEKQTERLPSFEQRNKGKNETERRKFAREILHGEQVEVVNDGNHEYVLVKPEAYNDDMRAMVEDAKGKGIELGFFVGNARVFGEDITEDFYVDGIKLNSSKVLVRYDGSRTPQKIAKHEMVHAKWNTSAIQKIKDTILGSLSAKEKQAILSQERYARYKSETYNGSEEIALEEFVCDTMSGMNDYTEKYIDTVNDYWYGDESVESYNAADYTTSTDAGGERYSQSKNERSALNGYEQNSNSEKLGRLQHSSKNERPSRVDDVGQIQSKKPDTPHTRKIHRSGVSAETLTSSGLTAEQAALREQNATDGVRSEFYTKAKIDGEEQAKFFNTENSAYYPDAVFERNGISVKGGIASFTEKRFNDLIEEYSVPVGGQLNRDYAKAYVAYISPSDFLRLTTINEELIVYDTERYGKLDVEVLKNNDVRQGPYLEIDFEDGRVYEHNGRHRMVMLRDAGIEKVAIVIRDMSSEQNKYKTAKHTDITLLGQKFYGGESAPGKVTLDEVIPLSPNYRNEVREKFVDTPATIRYSISKEQNTDYMKAVENGDMETAQKMVDEVAEKAFSDSKVRGTDGKLLKVYHGTVNDFTVFKREFANIEGDFGKGYYFTSNEYDVDANYANEEGPDLKNKIAHYAEKLEWEDEYSDLSYEEREEIARQKFITSEPNTITAYLNMENPVYITPDEKGTLLDFNEEYDEEYDEYGEPEGLLVDFIEALNEIAADYSYGAVDFNFLYDYDYDNGGVFASDAVGTIKRRISDELTDDNGDLALNEVIRLAFEQIGFDGIIDTSVYYKFRNMDGMDSGTTHYIVFDSEQIKSAEPVTYDDKGNAISLDDRFNKDNVDFRYSVSKPDNLKTQKRIEDIAQEIGSHEEFIELAKQNTEEFVDKIKENKNLQKRLDNAKRQMLKSPKPAVNVVKVGKITQEILKEVDSTLNAKDLREEITSIYNEYFAAIKDAKGVESKVKEANDTMLGRFHNLAVDIANSGEVFTESEEYEMLKSYIKNTRIKVPDSAKADAHYAEFRKSHMGTFNLTNDGTDIDVVYMELCSLFPGKFDETISHPADQLLEMDRVLEGLKPYAYNPNLEYMEDIIDHIVYRFASEVDGLAVMPKTKAEKMAEKSAVDKAEALEKERAKFEQEMEKHKKDSEDVIRKMQKKIDDANYVGYWEKRLSKEEKAKALKELRDKRDSANLKAQIRNIVSDMKQNLYKTEDKGGYPKELVKAAAEVLGALDFRTGKTNKDGSPTVTTLNLEALKAEYDALATNPNYDFESEYNETLSAKIEALRTDVNGKRVNELTKEELTSLKEILSDIRHTLSVASKQISNKQSIEDSIENAHLVMQAIEELSAMDDVAKQEEFWKGMKLAIADFDAFILNPGRVFEMIANYDKNSALYKLFDSINRGERVRKKFRMDATMPFDELTDGGGNEVAFYDFRTKGINTGIKYQDGSDVVVPKSIICQLIMTWNRKAGKTHLAAHGCTIPDMKLFNKGERSEKAIKTLAKTTNKITQADIDRLKGMLDSYDKAWMERAHYFFNKVGKDAINEISMLLQGREIATTKDYIRLYVDSHYLGKEVELSDAEQTLESHGSLKKTKPGAKQPLILTGLQDAVYDYIDFTSKYYGLAIPIRNFKKVYNSKLEGTSGTTVQGLLDKKMGARIRSGVVDRYISELQAPRKKDLTWFDRVRGRVIGGMFWGKITSALKQTSSYWTGGAILSEGSLAKGLGQFAKHPKQTKAEIAKYSGTLYDRAQGLSTTELGDRANRKRLAGASNRVDKAINKYAPVLRKIPEGLRPGNWLQAMDVNTSAALWEACKAEVSKTMKATDEGYMQAVTDLWERVIEETQSNYDIGHRPEALKNTNALIQAATMFTTDLFQKSGIIHSAFGDYSAKSAMVKQAEAQFKKEGSETNKKALEKAEKAKKEASKRVSKAARSLVYSSVWLGVAHLLGQMLLRKFKPYIDEEEKEINAVSVAKQFGQVVTEDIFTSILPVAGQGLLDLIDTFVKDYELLNEISIDALEDSIKGAADISTAAFDDKEGNFWGTFWDALPKVLTPFGLPAQNVKDLFNSVKGYAGDIMAGEFAHDLTDYTSGNKSFYNYGDLASYIVSGKSEKEKKWREYYSANGKEIAKGSLSKEIKPAYVQMFVDSPNEAYTIKRKLILDYDYSEETIGKWTVAEYFENCLENPEYASEIANAVLTNWEDYLYSAIRSKYKSAYKEGNADDVAYLREALINDFGISSYDIDDWEYEAEEKLQEQSDEQEAEKKKYK